MSNPHNIAQHFLLFLGHAREQIAKAGGNDGPLRLKLTHTRRVLRNASRIARSEGFSPALCRVCRLSALFHDIARFPQYLEFHSFRDRETRNHGCWGVQILKKSGWLDGEEAETRRLVLAAIALHNRYSLPAALAQKARPAALTLRDADKLDILRVLHAHLDRPGPHNPTVVLNLPETAGPASPVVRKAVMEGRLAAYTDLKSVNDFRMLLGTWFLDLNFTASRLQYLADGHARAIVAALPDDASYGPPRRKLLAMFDSWRP